MTEARIERRIRKARRAASAARRLLRQAPVCEATGIAKLDSKLRSVSRV